MIEPKPGTSRPRQRPRATLRDVAAAAGVSLASTSRTLADPDAGSAKLRARVEKACAELSYIPNHVARSLSTERSLAIGIITPTIDSSVFAPMLQEAIETFAASGYATLIAACHRSAAEEFKHLQSFAARGIDGVLLGNPDHTDEAFALLRQLKVPFVCIGGSPRSGHPNAVTFDGAAAMKLTVDRVVAAGHSEIAVLSGPASLASVIADRLDGTLAALRAHGIVPNRRWVLQEDFAIEPASKRIERLLTATRRPTAVICTGDYHAAVVLSVAHRLAIPMPDELSITGCNELFYMQLMHPRITTIRTPYLEMGRTAAGMLLAMLGGKAHPASISLPSTLVEGDTVRRLHDALSAK